MRILVAHNRYQEPGGEDAVFAAEASLLESRGQVVVRYEVDNANIDAMSRPALARATIWNPQTVRDVRALIRRARPDVLHAHNTFPLISPALYHAARAERVPVVQTLHNYRLVCPKAQLFRDGRVCEACVGRAVPTPGVLHACYRRSRAQSLGVASMLAVHRAAGTWAHAVDVYLALTESARDTFVRGGLPAEKIIVKPNFVAADPGEGEHGGGYALFVGRLSEEKGVAMMLSAWARVGQALPLRIVGDGPMSDRARAAAATVPGVEWLGRQERATVMQLMRDATVLIVPSLWPEPFGLVVAEGFATGLPAIVSDVGALSSLVTHGRTGRHFTAGSEDALVEQVRWVLDHPAALAPMRRASRLEYATRYTPALNYAMLMRVYERAVARSASLRRHHPIVRDAGPRPTVAGVTG